MELVEVKCLKQLNEDKVQETIKLMTNQFKEILRLMNNCESLAINVLKRRMAVEQCLVALIDNKIIGMIAVSVATKSTFELRLNELIKELGFFSGIRCYLSSQSQLVLKSNECYIHSLCVDKEYRGQGIGKLLLERCMTYFESDVYVLDVLAVNEEAIQLYKSYDFKVVSDQKRLGQKRYFVMKRSLIS